MMLRVSLVLLALFAFSCGASTEPDEPWTSYDLRGEIVDLRPGDPNVAYVDHEEIPGFMGAMTMGYPVRDAAEFSKLTVGDRIEAKVMARGHSEYYLKDIQVTGAPAPAAAEKGSEQQ
ncbi:MAG: copper-binding protein [Bryobacterales bacterium]